jgi:tRNA modification GTPase
MPASPAAAQQRSCEPTVFSTDDTITAIATPHGRGGIGVIRISGAEAERIARALAAQQEAFAPRVATFARVADDHALVTYFPHPHSYTGEDVVEIAAHGSPVVLDAILRRAIACGARLAEPGEFTLRAFLHGKLDLVQAEAVADLIDAVTPLQARAAFDQLEGTLTTAIGGIEGALFELIAKLEASLDFPEEGYHFIEPGTVVTAIDAVITEINDLLASAARGRLIREGAQVTIVGAPNVGKSSLFNALLNANRAIVTPVPGTTRDLLAERLEILGMSVALIDTAGIRDSADIVEQEGIARARQAVNVADLVLVVLDQSRAINDDDRAILESTAPQRRVIILNKIDLPAAAAPQIADAIPISVRTGEGLDALTNAIASAIGSAPERRDQPRVTNIRHITLLERARDALTRGRDALRAADGALSEEFVLADLQDASAHLQEITGKRTTDDLLRHIFERFCIGK